MRCAVKNCKNHNKMKSCTLSFFNFPSDPVLMKKWKSFCCRDMNLNVKTSQICMEHFSPEDFENTLQYEMGFTKKRYLKSGAVPSIRKTSTNEELYSERAKRLDKRENKKLVERLLQEHKSSATLVINASDSLDEGEESESSEPIDPLKIKEEVEEIEEIEEEETCSSEEMEIKQEELNIIDSEENCSNLEEPFKGKIMVRSNLEMTAACPATRSKTIGQVPATVKVLAPALLTTTTTMTMTTSSASVASPAPSKTLASAPVSNPEPKLKESEKVAPPEKVLYDNRIKRKNVLALNEKVAALREYEKEPVYKRVGRLFHCSPDQIKRIVQQKESILKAWEQRTRRSQDAKTLQMKVVRVSMLGKAVYDWLRRMMYYKDFNITDGLIQKMALQFKSAMGLQNFFPHTEWCDKFRQTYNIKESDTKLLNIGYTQGYSVQIKDVVKDVLSECTPDTHGDDDDDDEEEEKNQNQTDENDNEQRNEIPPAVVATATQKNSPNLANHKMNSLQQFKPGTQLVALPLQGKSVGGPQKVLVATPIATPGQLRNPSSMTMTIIPFATLSKSQLQNNQPNSPASLKITSITSSASTQNSNSITTSSSTAGTQDKPPEDKSRFPVPLDDIKKEIKEEPQDSYIKEECISEPEDEDADSKEFQTALPALNSLTSSPIVQSSDLSPNEDTATISSSNSQALNQESSASSTAQVSTESSVINNSVTLALANSLGPAVTLTKAAPKLIPAPGMSPKNSSNDKVINGLTQNKETVSSASTPPMPSLTKAPNFQNQTQNQNQSRKRKRTESEDSSGLPAIRTSAEARRYLKVLEDFALFRENFRLIGLLTRADEVLRDLEGEESDKEHLGND